MQKLARIELARVKYIPKQLTPGVLYVSEEFGAAVHLCACGCGNKVSTPLSPVRWALTEANGKPTLRPSVGNWEFDCQSHYWISDGEIIWSTKWSPERIAAGRRREESRLRAYYDAHARLRAGMLSRIWRWLKDKLAGK